MSKRITTLIIAGILFMSITGAQEGLTISEILYQPRSGEAEYVELYNPTTTAIDLSDYAIVRWTGDTLGKHYPLPSHIVNPKDYVVLTKDALSVSANYMVRFPSKLVECSLPTYPNDGGSVILCLVGSDYMERLDYTPAMHSRLLRNKGGVALERRSLERPCNDASNWFSAASTAGYGTPGYANSQSTEFLAEETSFVLSSTLLSPDGDGYQDELQIDYRLDDGELMASVMVFNPQGQVVRHLLNNALLGVHGEILWNGRDDGGGDLPLGRYVLHIMLFDREGTQQMVRRTVSLVSR